MKKPILITCALILLAFGSMHAQIIGALQLTTSVTVATACVAPCDGTANVKAAGGTPPYTYNWSSTPTQTTATATGLCPGTYTVLVNDANAGIPNYATATVTITCNSGTGGSLSVSVTPTPANTCVAPCDGSALATASGGLAPYTYAWSSIPVQSTQNVTGLCPGTYTVVVRDATTPMPNMASMTTTITCSMIGPGALAVTTTVTAATNCTAPCNGTATAIAAGGTPPYSYVWATTPTQTTQTATGLCPGSYSVTVYDSGSSIGTAKGVATITCSGTIGIGSIFLDENISLFPNPANDQLNLQFSVAMDQVSISVRSILGTELLRDAFDVKGNYIRTLDISSLPAGIYSLEIIAGEAVLTKQFIRQ